MLEIRNIQKRFGSQTALENVSVTIETGEFFSLLGPSGCGKSTLLRILAGLEAPTSGEILWKGQRIDPWPARLRPFNMVFQKYALFPHLSVFENVAFGLRLKKTPGAEIESRVSEALELVNLANFSQRLPETLSGGQAQRVALARAIVNRPECILLDEPLTALDQKLREHMQTELRQLQRRLGLTFIFVTHDQEEAMLMSDRIAVMNGGRIEQVSTPRELYESPSSLFCARFIGSMNEIFGEVVEKESGWVSFAMGPASVSAGSAPVIRGRSSCEALNASGLGPARAFIRPERMKLLAGQEASTPGFNVVEGEVLQVSYRGLRTEVVVGLQESLFLRSLLPSEIESASVRVGDRIGLEFAPEQTYIFKAAQ